MVNKKSPLRKCTGCQEMKEKMALIRIVKTGENKYELDTTGKKAGRGAYICKSEKCLNKVAKNRGLERSFKSAIPKDIYEKLRKELKTDE